jgi:hypothetical protein
MNDTPAKKKLITYLKQQHPNVEDNDIPPLLSDIKRFVTVVQKIYTEPQAQIKFKEKKVNGKIVKYKVVETDIEEFGKVRGKNETKIPIIEAIHRFNKAVNKK